MSRADIYNLNESPWKMTTSSGLINTDDDDAGSLYNKRHGTVSSISYLP